MLCCHLYLLTIGSFLSGLVPLLADIYVVRLGVATYLQAQGCTPAAWEVWALC